MQRQQCKRIVLAVPRFRYVRSKHVREVRKQHRLHSGQDADLTNVQVNPRELCVVWRGQETYMVCCVRYSAAAIRSNQNTTLGSRALRCQLLLLLPSNTVVIEFQSPLAGSALKKILQQIIRQTFFARTHVRSHTRTGATGEVVW